MPLSKLSFIISYVPYKNKPLDYYDTVILNVRGETIYADDMSDDDDMVQEFYFDIEGQGKLDGKYRLYINKDNTATTKLYKIAPNGEKYLIHSANYDTDFQKNKEFIRSGFNEFFETLGYVESDWD